MKTQPSGPLSANRNGFIRMIFDAIEYFAQMNLLDFVKMFWVVFLIDVPRFFLATLAVGLKWVAGAPLPKSDVNVPISIMLVGHNEGDSLEQAIISLRHQTQKNREIIVVEDGSTDNFREVGQKLEKQGLIDCFISTDLRGGKAAALNLAIAHCTHDIIISCDIDTSFDDDAMERIVAPLLHDPTIAAVSGNVAVRNASDNYITRMQAIEYALKISLARQFLADLDILAIVSGAFGAFRRSLVMGVSGWDVGPGDDGNLTMKLRQEGWSVAFAPDAWSLTDVPTRVSALINQRLRWDRSNVRHRLRKFSGQLNPFSAAFSVREALQSLNGLYFGFFLSLSHAIYLIFAIINYGFYTFFILIAIALIYTFISAMGLLLACLSLGKPGLWKLWLYIPGYPFYSGFYLHAIRLVANLSELIFRSSYKDTFYPTKVRESVDKW